MTLKVGTLCLLVKDHPRAGQQCTVRGLVVPPDRFCRIHDGEFYDGEAYSIALATSEPCHPGARGWGAARDQLFPLAEPITPKFIVDEYNRVTDRIRETVDRMRVRQ